MNFVRQIRRALRPPEAILTASDLETGLAVSLLHTISIGLVLWCAVYFAVLLPFFVVRKAVAGGMTAVILCGALGSLGMLYRCASNGEVLRSAVLLKRQVRRASWLLIGVISGVVTAYIMLDGGAQSRALFVLVATSVVALVLLGQRVATIFFAFFLTLTLIFSLLQHYGIAMPRYFPGEAITLWYTVVLITGLIAYPLIRTFATLREAIRQVRENEEGLRTILETAPDGVFILNGEGRVVEANQSALRQLDYTREELLGMYLMDIVPPELRERAARHFPEMKGPVVSEGVHVRKDGTRIPVAVTARRITFRGEPGMLGIARDITDRKRAEEQRMQLERQLQQAHRLESLGRLAGGVAHDFNNLLTVINGQTRLALARPETGDAVRHRLEQILKAGESAAGLTGQLLAFSRQQVLQPNVIDLNAVVTGMRSMLGPMMGDDVEVRLDLDDEAVPVFADGHQLAQVIMNLAVNARDAMPNGGCLGIGTSIVHWGESNAGQNPDGRAGLDAVLTVSDSGIGMDEATKQRIFEPFFTTKETGVGTGLGLSMVQGIVAQSGGYIDVETKPGRGTTFRIFLPLRSGEEIRREEAAREPERSGGETVLVVEDRAEVRQYVCDVLRSYGYQVIETANAEEALKRSDRIANIDLVLADVVMAGMSGVDLVGHLTNQRPGTKALFMSGYTDRMIPQGAAGGPAFLQKPFSPEELAEKVRSVLSQKFI